MRLFIAINISRELKNKLAAMLEELKKLEMPVKWVKPENLHLTLKFLGEVNPGKLDDVSRALKKSVIGIEPWDIEIAGVGTFPNWRAARVVWLGIKSGPVLGMLHQKITEEYQALGFPQEALTPHLTLGRVRSKISTELLFESLQKFGDKSWGKERVTAISLMESRLSRRGAEYTPILTVNLLEGQI